MDYEKLLRAYMKHIGDIEGTLYEGSLEFKRDKLDITEDELKEILRIANIVYAEDLDI